MQIILDNMFEKSHRDRLRNNRSLGNEKSDNKKEKTNDNNNNDDDDDLGGAWRPVWVCKKQHSMLALCKTKDAVSGSELYNAHIMIVTLTQCQTHTD